VTSDVIWYGDGEENSSIFSLIRMR